MNGSARLAFVLFAFSLCASGVMIAHRSPDVLPSAGSESKSAGSDYEQITTGSHPDLAFSEFETIIRRHSTVRAHRGRIEFGSVKFEGANVIVQVLFFAADEQMTPYFYTLTPKDQTWKVADVQRIWFLPRSSLLRGLKV